MPHGQRKEESVRNSPANTKVRGSREKMLLGGTEIPLQPLEEAIVKQAFQIGIAACRASPTPEQGNSDGVAGRGGYGLTRHPIPHPRGALGGAGRGLRNEGVKMSLGKGVGES